MIIWWTLRPSESWVASISVIEDCGNFCRWLVRFTKARQVLANGHFKSLSQKNVRKLCGLSSSLTSTEGGNATAGSGWASPRPPSVGHWGKLPSFYTVCWSVCRTYPVTQTSRPVFPDLITLLGRWSRLRNERLCGIVVKGTDSGVTLLGPKAWLSHCLAEWLWTSYLNCLCLIFHL